MTCPPGSAVALEAIEHNLKVIAQNNLTSLRLFIFLMVEVMSSNFDSRYVCVFLEEM